MSHGNTTASSDSFSDVTHWSAVFAFAFSVAVVVITELLPVSLLSPMAEDLAISEGMAGQSMTATALVAVVSSLLITRVTKGIDRRHVILAFSLILTLSNVLVVFAGNFAVLTLGRLLLGVALGGLWSMAPSLTMRLAAPSKVPRALSIVFGGLSVALVLAAPLGSYLGTLIGWRGVFAGAAVLGVICAIWQWLSMPGMPSTRVNTLSDLWQVARHPRMRIGIVAQFCVFAGQFSFFSYMRPFYESWVGLESHHLSLIFLAFGVANFIGTSFSSRVIEANLKGTLVVAPLIIGACALGLALFGTHIGWMILLTLIWGFVFGTVPVGWSTWVTRHFANDPENAGGLQVATIQFANMTGAALGGYLLTVGNATTPVLLAGVLMLVTSLIVAMKIHPDSRT
ncbi:MFS transporter, DHA1 family, purine ribonucleoside efflux pump [Kushneria avicenniae]|uniref:MFS transporter, DHA1 family, purine ribonucleoside efflux pump n=1 Tax=Kushneria avicenniae TaxID=402385 RepID=A0A1I1G5F2_9GAMM|nr:MFS transporter [Kushneria avicenniae]SFC06977.1 MFS transporter, DHA1 family, purine ribonucleoside efflux pump [Kushneria avicenniae]